jgi:hypothetical protein
MTTRTRWLQLALAVAGVLLGLLAYRVQMDNIPTTTELRSCGSVFAAWSFLFAGLVAWMRRPQNRLGLLMIATCFALLARQFRYSHHELVFTLFFLVGELGWALFAHVTFAYPFGRVADRVERAFLWRRTSSRSPFRWRSSWSTEGPSGCATSIRSRARA